MTSGYTITDLTLDAPKIKAILDEYNKEIEELSNMLISVNSSV